MATTMSGAASADYDMSLWYDSKYYKIGLSLMLGLAIFWIWYQRTFAYFSRDGLNGAYL